MGLKNIQNAIRKSWDQDTCYPSVKDNWKKDLPELGQCAVTALLIQDKLGGNIVFDETNNHFWNILPNGETIDLTRKQFSDEVKIVPMYIVDRNYLLFSESAKRQKTLARYKLLKKRVNSYLSHY